MITLGTGLLPAFSTAAIVPEATASALVAVAGAVSAAEAAAALTWRPAGTTVAVARAVAAAWRIAILKRAARTVTVAAAVATGPLWAVASAESVPVPIGPLRTIGTPLTTRPAVAGRAAAVIAALERPTTTIVAALERPTTTVITGLERPTTTVITALERPTTTVITGLERPTTTVITALERPTTTVIAALERPTTTVITALERPTTTVITALERPTTTVITIPGAVPSAEATAALTWGTRAVPFPAAFTVVPETPPALAVVAWRSGAPLVGPERTASAVVTVSEAATGLGGAAVTGRALRAVSSAISTAVVVRTGRTVSEAASLTRGTAAVTSTGAAVVAVAVATTRCVTITVGGPRPIAGAETVTVTVGPATSFAAGACPRPAGRPTFAVAETAGTVRAEGAVATIAISRGTFTPPRITATRAVPTPIAAVAPGATAHVPALVTAVSATARAVTPVFSVHFCPLLLAHRVRLCARFAGRATSSRIRRAVEMPDIGSVSGETSLICRRSAETSLCAVASATRSTQRRPPVVGWPGRFQPSAPPAVPGPEGGGQSSW
ncbi:hypothetical protein ACFQ0J_39710 [Planotetraspora mira]|uniref:hypothetical protein n=2 Tax=Planotetraspora mira TaxID=58121 RepID=UPI00366C1E94